MTPRNARPRSRPGVMRRWLYIYSRIGYVFARANVALAVILMIVASRYYWKV